MQTGRFERGRAVIGRPRLIECLARAATDRIALIAAPAGFGKSVLLRAYLAAHPARRRVTYRLGAGNRTPLGFVRGFVEALGTVGPAPPLAAFVHSNGARKNRRLREWFLDALSGFSGTVVLDDLHLGTATRAAADFVARIIDEAGGVRWIVATRSLARLPVASWIAHGDVGEIIGESDLSLTPVEVREIARACGLGDDPSLTEHVAQLAQGWPTAFSFGIGLAAEGYAPRGVTRHTSAFVYQVLAEQVFARLRSEQREFLLETCLLPSIDPPVLARALRADAQEIVASLEQQAAFISPDGHGGFFYHDLFKSFLRSEFLKLPAAHVNASIRRACDVLLQAGEHEAAIDLCVGIDAYGLAAEALERVGFELLDGGYVDVVERATRSLRAAELRYPIVVALDACLESLQGNYVRAEELFAEAVAKTSGELRVAVTLRYAVDLLNRREFERADRLLAIDVDATLRPELRADALAVRGFAAAQGGRGAAARAYIGQALELTGALADQRVVGMTHHRAALAYYALSDLTRARALALSAVRLADRCGVAGLSARARISLAVIAGEQGDLETHNRIYRELRDLAKAAADRNLMFVVAMDAFWAEVEAGNVAASESLERELRQFDATPFRRSEDTLLSAYALKAAWSGDFAAAHGYVAGTAERLTTAARRAQRFAENALYAVAAGLVHEAAAAATNAFEALRTVGGAKGLSRIVLARCFLGLALAAAGRPDAADEVLGAVSFSSGDQRKHFGAFVAAALAFVRFCRGDGAALAAALERLRGSLLGGYAPLIERLRELHAADSPDELAPLSASERAVLAHVERGLSSKEIAAAMSRSPQTVDTHVKAILRKLQCRGRGEAAYLARRRGLLD